MSATYTPATAVVPLAELASEARRFRDGLAADIVALYPFVAGTEDFRIMSTGH